MYSDRYEDIVFAAMAKRRRDAPVLLAAQVGRQTRPKPCRGRRHMEHSRSENSVHSSEIAVGGTKERWQN
jgi:hypothetical protein